MGKGKQILKLAAKHADAKEKKRRMSIEDPAKEEQQESISEQKAEESNPNLEKSEMLPKKARKVFKRR